MPTAAVRGPPRSGHYQHLIPPKSHWLPPRSRTLTPTSTLRSLGAILRPFEARKSKVDVVTFTNLRPRRNRLTASEGDHRANGPSPGSGCQTSLKACHWSSSNSRPDHFDTSLSACPRRWRVESPNRVSSRYLACGTCSIPRWSDTFDSAERVPKCAWLSGKVEAAGIEPASMTARRKRLQA